MTCRDRIRVRYDAGRWHVHPPGEPPLSAPTRGEAVALARQYATGYASIELHDPRHDTWRTIPV